MEKFFDILGWVIGIFADVFIIIYFLSSNILAIEIPVKNESNGSNRPIQVIEPVVIEEQETEEEIIRHVDPLSKNYWIDIDLEEQKLYLYKNDELITYGDIVSGYKDVCDTPTGRYFIQYKEEDAYLSGGNEADGSDYVRRVNYWMPFYGNYGIHDAEWRTEFGGDIYKTNGSHGCINISLDLAKEIYPLIDVGTIVNIN